MSLEYYLFYKNHYEDSIRDLDNTINSSTEPMNAFFLLERKHYITELKEICDKKILELSCNHEFEDDMIDINPERSQNITYCKICGYTK
jgi:hypothetical protein